MESPTLQARIRGYLRIARFDHWIKQAFVLPGIAFGVALSPQLDGGVLRRFLLGMLAACLIASANYIINEWLDAAFDRFHPTKKNRPAVAGYLEAKYVYLEYALFVTLGLYLAYLASPPLFVTAALLLLMGVVYNVKPLRSKDVPYIDVLSESVNNALRLLIGWFIATSSYFPPITIVLGYWMGGAFLMAAKRFAEYRMIHDKTTAGLYRRSFAKYTEESLLVSMFFYGMLSLFFCGIFLIKYRVELLLAIPLLCGLFCYYLSMSYRYDSPAQKPEKLFRDKGLMFCLAAFAAIVLFCIFVDNPFFATLQDTTLLRP